MFKSLLISLRALKKLIFLFFTKPKIGLNLIKTILWGMRDPLKSIDYEILSHDQTIIHLKLKKKLIRLGDGDSRYYFMGYNDFQTKYEESLISSIEDIVKNYSNSSNYILAIPYHEIKGNFLKLIINGKFRTWYDTRALLNMFLKSNIKYRFADSFIFKANLGGKSYDSFRSAWTGKHIRIINDSESVANKLLKDNNQSSFKDFLQIQSRNAFDQLDLIKKFISLDNDQDTVYLISAGNVTRWLIYNVDFGYATAIDLGNFN